MSLCAARFDCWFQQQFHATTSIENKQHFEKKIQYKDIHTKEWTVSTYDEKYIKIIDNCSIQNHCKVNSFIHVPHSLVYISFIDSHGASQLEQHQM